MKISNKKAFTFAELMISLVIIAVITAILYPTISELAPNNNKHLFRSAYKTIELVVSEITADSVNGTISSPTPDASGNYPTASARELCQYFEKKLNTVSMTNNAVPPAAVANCADGDPQLKTSNGMRWFFSQSGNCPDGNGLKYPIYVDVNASNNKILSESDGTAEGNAVKAKWAEGAFYLNNTTARDTFIIDICGSGKIIVSDSVAAQHLQDDDSEH